MTTSHALTFLGNLQDAAGWRLAGAYTVTPASGGEAAALAALLRSATVVLISSEVAAKLPPDVLEPALTALHPLVLVVPAARGGLSAAIDPAERVRRQLGIEPDPADASTASTP